MEFLDNLWFEITKRFRKWRKVSMILCAILIVFIIFNKPILSAAGNFLIKETPLEKADAIFILGGNIRDRPVAAALLFKEGWSKKLIPMGANFDLAQELVSGCSAEDSTCLTDALLMREFLETHLNIPDSCIVPISKGTSTKEEQQEILKFSLANNYKTIIVISDYFHLRRIHNIFVERFAAQGIKVILRGAKSSQYKESTWWASEQGLIMVNNEYVKLMFYLLKGY